MTRAEYLAKLKDMYDGYKFSPYGQAVYNPVSAGSFFDDGGRTFIGYRAETGGTKLELDVAGKVDFSLARDLTEPLDESDMANFDITRLSKSTVTPLELKWLLYQTGYLPIGHVEPGLLGERRFFLRFPSREVEDSKNQTPTPSSPVSTRKGPPRRQPLSRKPVSFVFSR